MAESIKLSREMKEIIGYMRKGNYLIHIAKLASHKYKEDQISLSSEGWKVSLKTFTKMQNQGLLKICDKVAYQTDFILSELGDSIQL